MSNRNHADLLARLDTLTPQELKRYLAQEFTRKSLGLVNCPQEVGHHPAYWGIE